MLNLEMHVGMTGTREGMTDFQKETFVELLEEFQVIGAEVFHHGDCIGADAESHEMAEDLGYRCVIHPPEKTEVRAFCESEYVWPEKGYFARNRDIVDCADVMLATPVTEFETKGGTWYTINYAKKKNKRLTIIYPSGRLEEFGE